MRLPGNTWRVFVVAIVRRRIIDRGKSAEKSPLLIATVGIVLFTVDGLPALQGLPGEEEEKLVLLDGPAKCESVVVALERRFFGGIEEVPRIHLLVAQKVVRDAVKEVGARFQGEIHHAARRSAEFGGVSAGLHFEFLDGIDGGFDDLGLVGIEGRIIGIVIKSVEQVVIVGGSLSARAEPAGPAADAVIGAGRSTALAGRGERALGKQGELQVIASVQRQVFDSALLDHLSL